MNVTSSGRYNKANIFLGLIEYSCDCWNVTGKYSWNNADKRKQLSMDQTCSDNNRGD